MTELSLDYETFSEIDIFKEGGAKYVRDPSTQILMLGWAIDDDPVQLWQPHIEAMPGELREAMRDPAVLKWAFNAPFEEGITTHVLPKYVSDVTVHVDTWRCTQFLAYGMSFMKGLDDVLKQAGFPANLQKDNDGKRLIRKFSKPQPRNHNVKRWYPWTAPEDWQLFCDYCVQDVTVERALRRWLLQFDPISPEEWTTWQLDQRINQRGIPLDMELIDVAIRRVDARKSELKHELQTITGLDNPTSNQQLLPWLQQYGVPLENMQATSLDWVIPRIDDPHLRGVVQRKRWYSQTATSKWEAFKRMSYDGRLIGMFMSAGASRTRRYASRGINLQNLKRPVVKDMGQECENIKTGFGHPDIEEMDMLATSVRGAIAAPPGSMLAVCDLGSIESRVVGWLAGCQRINRIFADGMDTYKDFATEFYGVPYRDVTKEQRTFCKPPVLGAAYQLGAGGLVRYADDMGVQMEDHEARRAIKVWRAAYFEIPKLWSWLTDSVEAVTTKWSTISGYRLTIFRDSEFLYITLPSGRRLTYHKPEIQEREISWVDETGQYNTMVKPSFTYMGFNRFNMQWGRIATHGGGLTENIVQAISRDILVYQMGVADHYGHQIVGHVHDEIIAECPETNADGWLASLRSAMCVSPPWAPDLLLDAQGYVGKHYRKD